MRVHLDIEPELWKQAKLAAVTAGEPLMTPDGWVVKAIKERLEKYEKYIK